jgi:hypothetical protein
MVAGVGLSRPPRRANGATAVRHVESLADDLEGDPVGSIYSFSALIWSFTGRQCVGCDGRNEVSSRRLPLVPPHRLLLEKPQVNQRTEYLDSTSR